MNGWNLDSKNDVERISELVAGQAADLICKSCSIMCNNFDEGEMQKYADLLQKCIDRTTSFIKQKIDEIERRNF